MTRSLGFFIAFVGLSSFAVGGCTKASADGSAKPKGPIAVVVDAKGFTPSSVSFTKRQPAVLVFTRTTDDTCATEVVFPELKIRKPLPLNTPVTIEVPTTEARTLTFQCGMGMYKSSIVIHEN